MANSLIRTVIAAITGTGTPETTFAPTVVIEIPAPKPVQEPSGNGRILQETGLRVTHIRRSDGHDLTVAYRPRRARNHTMELAVSNRNPEDVFSRKLGTSYAIANFIDGNTIRIPPLGDLSDIQLIQATFFGGRYDGLGQLVEVLD